MARRALSLCFLALTIQATLRAEPLTVSGRTEPAPGRSAAIAPQVLQPVREVLVREGDHVDQDQPLIRHDDDEAVAEVKGKKAKLAQIKADLEQLVKEPRQQKIGEARAEYAKAQAETRAAQEEFGRLEPVFRQGAVPEKTYRDAVARLEKARHEERGAQQKVEEIRLDPVYARIASLESQRRQAEAELEGAQATLDNHTIVARIAGVVADLHVRPGDIVRPGTAVWGVVLDLSEIDVRCLVTPAQARGLEVGQSAEIAAEDGTALGRGRVAMIGAAADLGTGRMPVVVRLADAAGRVPSGVSVRVTFAGR